jgi:hypothetical protein
MKRVITLSLVAFVLVFAACKSGSKKEETNETTGSTQPAAGEEQKSGTPANQPKEYKVTITPDSAILGKKKEALVKVVGATAMALTDADGKDNGIELTFKLTVTNKSHIGDGSSVSLYYTESRLQLDNGTSITHDSGTGNLSAQPESTSKEESWTYKIPANAKPTALNLFMDETRVSVGVSLSEK